MKLAVRSTLLGVVVATAAMSPVLAMGQEQVRASADQLRSDVIALSSSIPPRRAGNELGIAQAASFISEQFGKTGCRLSHQKYRAGGLPQKNILCSFGPPGASRIVIGAHYDVAGDLPGADDNASGVAGVLEVARMVGRYEGELTHRLDLVAYSTEEQPYFVGPEMGSFVHANSLREANVDVKFMMSVEMIGYFTDEANSQDYPDPAMHGFYPSVGNFVVVVGKQSQLDLVSNIADLLSAVGSVDALPVVAPDDVIEQTDLVRSDHGSFWRKGYTAVMLTDTSEFRNPHYHKASDTADTLDYVRMAEVVNGIYQLAISFE